MEHTNKKLDILKKVPQIMPAPPTGQVRTHVPYIKYGLGKPTIPPKTW